MAKGWADFSAIGRALRNRNYAIYTAGIAFSHTGLWVQRLAVGWLSWSLTESAFWVGAVAAADLFPVVFIGPFAGVLADRVNRLRLVFVCQALSAVQASVLFLLTAYDLITINLLLLLTLVLGVISGLNQPARQSLVPSLVRAEDMTSAVALNSVVFNVARFTGPAIAGVVIAGYGVTPAFAINAVSFLCVLFALSRLRLPEQAGRRARRGRVLVDLLVGVRYVRGHRLIGPLLLMSLAMSLFVRPVNELLPAVSELLFAQGAAGLAMLTAARGAGALAAGLWLAKRGHVDGLVRNIVFSLLVASVSVFVLVGTGYFWIALLAFTAFGFAMSTGGVGSITMIQVAVDNRLRGRVLSLNGLTLRGLPALGALLMGWAADRLGLVVPLSVGAGLCAVIFLIALRWERRARGRIAELSSD
ncbi:MAG: MFS transporter [Alphaproteobacteria bacterium]|nr:MFS transporter [Alphaproteobacteria bacterium]